MKEINLKNFKGIDIDIDLEKVIKENSTEAVFKLQLTSPEQKFVRPKNYASGWNFKMETAGLKQPVSKIWNKTNWQLTWLLENGHLIVNKKGGVGWSAPRKHIERVFDIQSKKFIDDCENIDIDIDFK